MRARGAVVCDCDLICDTVVEVDDLLSVRECDYLIDQAILRARKVGWAEVQHGAYATQDVKVWKMSRTAIKLVMEKVVGKLKPEIAEEFKLPASMVEIDDAFVVQYALGRQTSLQYHRDGAIVSAIVSLSEPSEYEGGGTIFKDKSVFRPDVGCGILFGGQRLHSGVKITSGTRYILTLFFQCGKLSCRDVAVAKDAEQDKENIMSGVADFFGLGG